MRARFPLISALAMLTALGVGVIRATNAADTPKVTAAAPPAAATAPPPSDADLAAVGSNDAKARALVDSAINMTDSDRAVKLLWQATDLDPTLDEAYIYLGLYYNSRSQWDKLAAVYQKLIKYQPKSASAYFNIGEAYMSFSPPRFDAALPYYRQSFQLDPSNTYTALRIGEIYAQQNNRDEALRYLRMASADRKNPSAAAEADKILHQITGP